MRTGRRVADQRDRLCEGGRIRWRSDGSVLSVLAGLAVLSIIAEGIEVAIVSAVHGASTMSSPETYFAARNHTGILVAKFFYNTAAAGLAGYAAAWIAGRAPRAHGAGLALIQTALLVWGMVFSTYAGTTPAWVWVPLIPLMGGALWLGALAQGRSRRSSSARPAA